MSTERGRGSKGDVLLEFYRLGNAVKVSAVDPVTMTEVSIQGSATADERALRQAAIRKLLYRLRKDKSAGVTNP